MSPPGRPQERAGDAFVGRRAELGICHEAVESASIGMGSCVFACGEPGIGKSRLLAETRRYARGRGLRVLAGRCSEVAGAPAYWPWTQALRDLVEQVGEPTLRECAGPLLDRAGSLLPALKDGRRLAAAPIVEPPERRVRLFDAVVRLLGAVAEQVPILITLDDLHRADLDSLLLVRELCEEIREDRVALLAGYRDTEVPEPLRAALDEITASGRALQLGGLSSDDIASFVANRMGSPPSPSVCRALAERTAGNPLFLGETLRALGADLHGDDGAEAVRSAALPRSVRHVVERRVEGLPEATRGALTLASVLGSEVDLDVLAALCSKPSPSLLDELGPACEARLIGRSAAEPRRLLFEHAAIRDAIYESISERERVGYHEAVASILEQRDPLDRGDRLEQLVHHLHLAAPLPSPVRTAVWCERAGQHARGQLALDRAVDHFQSALRALDSTSLESADMRVRRCRVRLALADALGHVGETEESRRVYLAAADDARALGDVRALAQAAIGASGREHSPNDPPPPTVALLEEALSAYEPSDEPLRVRLLCASAYVDAHLARADRAQLRAREAMAMAERLKDGETAFVAALALHHALWNPENLAERLHLSERLRELATTSPSLRTELLSRHWRAVDLLEAGDVAGASVEIRHYERAAEELRRPFFLWMSAGLQAMLAILEGRHEEADALIHRSLALGRDAGSLHAAVALFGQQLFHLREDQGRLPELEELLEKVIADNPAIRAFEVTLPLLYADSDQREKARLSFDRLAAGHFEDFRRDAQWLPLIYSAARVCAYLDDRPRARELLDLLRPFESQCIVSGYGTYWAGPTTRYTAGLEATLGNRDAAARDFERAISDLRCAGARALLAHTLVEYAELLGTSGEPERAKALGLEASELYEAIGVARGIERAERVASGASGRRDEEPALVREGEDWRIAFRGSTTRVRDSKGLSDLASLLRRPYRDVHVFDLMRRPAATTGPGEASELSIRRAEPDRLNADDSAREAYRTRLRDLRDDLAGAERDRDLGRTEAIQAELDWLERELTARASGEVSKARKAVYNRVRAAMRRIEEHHPALGRHLRASIRTGTTCGYYPEAETEWIVSD